MFSTADTIVAIATPLGRSGLGVVRLSGPEANRIAAAMIGRTRPLAPRHATLARLRSPTASGDVAHRLTDSNGASIADQVVVTSFVAPASYTGEDVVEIAAHGSPVVLQAMVRLAIGAGARLAEPGEFTLRAFINGKLDLIQAEAVADLIDAVTPLQARAAFDQLEGTLTTAISAIEITLFELMAKLEASLDFPDEGYHFITPDQASESIAQVRGGIDRLLASAARGRLVREGAQVAIVGAPNVGKSSVFNALLNANRAIVTAVPGTTRDLLTERADIGGVSVALVDTAGLRESDDVVEQEGVTRARGAQRIADVVLLVLDRSRPLTAAEETLLDESGRRGIVVINKTDLPNAWGAPLAPERAPASVEISALVGTGLDRLAHLIATTLGGHSESRDAALVSNVRHITLLETARDALMRATDLTSGSGAVSEEFILADLQEAAAALQEITGHRTTDDLLHHIFQRFCVGK